LFDKNVLISKVDLENMLKKVNAAVFSKKFQKVPRAKLRKTLENLGCDVTLRNLEERKTEFKTSEIMKFLEKSNNGFIKRHEYKSAVKHAQRLS
jgi:Ca2+-binding EF-hand superfamily protein